MLKDTLVQDVDLFLLKPLMVSKYQAIILHNLCETFSYRKVGPKTRENLAKRLYSGDIKVWFGVTGPDDARRSIGMLFTTIYTDPDTDVKKLSIYGFNMKEQPTPEQQSKVLGLLEEYAKKSGCNIMIAQTKVRGVARLLERNGWGEEYVVLTKEF